MGIYPVKALIHLFFVRVVWVKTDPLINSQLVTFSLSAVFNMARIEFMARCNRLICKGALGQKLVMGTNQTTLHTFIQP